MENYLPQIYDAVKYNILSQVQISSLKKISFVIKIIFFI